MARRLNFNGTCKKLKLLKILQKKKKINYSIYKMLVIRNSKKQIIYDLKMIIFLMLLYFSSTLIKSKERNILTDETIAVCVSLRITKM
jgi:hypothetical protein